MTPELISHKVFVKNLRDIKMFVATNKGNLSDIYTHSYKGKISDTPSLYETCVYCYNSLNNNLNETLIKFSAQMEKYAHKGKSYSVMIGSSDVKDTLQYAYATKTLLIELYEIIRTIDSSTSGNTLLSDVLEDLQIESNQYENIKSLQLDTLLLLVYDCCTWFLKKGWKF
jgi:hypothetical protein